MLSCGSAVQKLHKFGITVIHWAARRMDWPGLSWNVFSFASHYYRQVHTANTSVSFNSFYTENEVKWYWRSWWHQPFSSSLPCLCECMCQWKLIRLFQWWVLSNPGQAHLSSISNQGSIYTQSTFALYLPVCLCQGNLLKSLQKILSF